MSIDSSTPDGIELATWNGHPMPLVVRATDPTTDAFDWAAAHRPWLEEKLQHHGALHFQGFDIDTPAKLDRFSRILSDDFPEFKEESSPRHRIDGMVQTSTDYPPEYPIQFHNEFSYSHTWPLRIYFGCAIASTTGGETPIADSRRVLARLSDATRERFERLGLLYRRNYTTGVGVSWQKAFDTEDRGEVESRCAERGIECEWSADGGRLTTSQRSAALATHPRTGESVWFNHGFFFNIHALEPVELREYMLTRPEEELSTNSYYGDGSPIDAETIEEIRAAHEAETVERRWEKGEVLWIDNMLAAHARRPYTGERRILTVLAEGCSQRD